MKNGINSSAEEIVLQRFLSNIFLLFDQHLPPRIQDHITQILRLRGGHVN